MKRHYACVGLLAVLALLASPSRLLAQSITGTIRGTVTDEQKAVVPDATVTVRNVATNAVRIAVTERTGSYRFPLARVTSPIICEAPPCQSA